MSARKLTGKDDLMPESEVLGTEFRPDFRLGFDIPPSPGLPVREMEDPKPQKKLSEYVPKEGDVWFSDRFGFPWLLVVKKVWLPGEKEGKRTIKQGAVTFLEWCFGGGGAMGGLITLGLPNFRIRIQSARSRKMEPENSYSLAD